MLPSIDSPQGDHADRRPATAARATPDARRARHARVHRPPRPPRTGWACPGPMPADASSPSAPGQPRAPRPTRPADRRPARSAASASASLQQRGHLRPRGRGSLAGDPAARPVHQHEVRRPGHPVPSHASVDITSGTPSGASSSSFDGLSSVGVLRHDHHARAAGNLRRGAQRLPERPARRGTRSTGTPAASSPARRPPRPSPRRRPASRPARSNASAASRAGGSGSPSGEPRRVRPPPRLPPAASPCPSSRRSSSAWLRSTPTSRMPITTSSTVSTPDQHVHHRASPYRQLASWLHTAFSTFSVPPQFTYSFARALALHDPAHDLGDARDLGVALPVPEHVAARPPLVAVVVRAVAAVRARRAGRPVAVDVVPDPLPRTRPAPR